MVWGLNIYVYENNIFVHNIIMSSVVNRVQMIEYKTIIENMEPIKKLRVKFPVTFVVKKSIKNIVYKIFIV